MSNHKELPKGSLICNALRVLIYALFLINLRLFTLTMIQMLYAGADLKWDDPFEIRGGVKALMVAIHIPEAITASTL